MGSIGVSLSRKSSAVSLHEEWRFEVWMIRRVRYLARKYQYKIKASTVVDEPKMLNTVSRRWGADMTMHEGEKKCRRQYKMPNLKEPDLLRQDMFPVKILRQGQIRNV